MKDGQGSVGKQMHIQLGSETVLYSSSKGGPAVFRNIRLPVKSPMGVSPPVEGMQFFFSLIHAVSCIFFSGTLLQVQIIKGFQSLPCDLPAVPVFYEKHGHEGQKSKDR